MLKTGAVAATWFAACVFAHAAGVERAAKPGASPQAQLDQQVQERSQARRKLQAPLPPAPPPSTGLVRYPVDVTKRTGLFKDAGSVVAERVPPPTSPTLDPPPCLYIPNNQLPSTVQPMKVAGLGANFGEVQWHVCVTDMGMKGLWVGPVHIRRTPGSPWITVLYQAGIADIFVPYHHLSQYRFYDMHWPLPAAQPLPAVPPPPPPYPPSNLDEVTPQDWGPNGYGIQLTNQGIPTVVEEVRDRGVGWLCKGDPGASGTRRARELVIWAVQDAGNYDNIIEYRFRDDGSIGFRMGNTGYNTTDHPLEAHSHSALWRVDIDLNGAANNTASWFTHVEPSPSSSAWAAQDFETPFGVEGARQWNASQYASLLIEDASTNAFGHHLGYEFTPDEPGISRHYGNSPLNPPYPTETWTQNDVYVTEYHFNEANWLDPSSWINSGIVAPGTSPEQFLLPMLNGEPVTNHDLVVWVNGSAHHDPTDEDRSNADLLSIPHIPNGRGSFTSNEPTTTVSGVTLVHWSGFDMEPHNLFNANPLGGPLRCGN